MMSDRMYTIILLSYVQRRIAKNCREKSIDCALEEIEKVKASIEELLIDELRNI
ncbi:MAG: hypothetical protein QXE10_02570 [Desulfurococcaceae archaeon]